VPSGNAAKPSLVGAKTVNGPAEVNVSTKSPATTAATRVERSGTDWASSTMLGKASDSPAGGSRTPSMMWATPFDALLSAPTTVLKSLPSGLTNTPLRVLYTCTLLPSTVFTLWKNFRSVDNTSDPKTWYVRMSTNVSLFSGFRSVSRVPSGKAANPSLVGAKTVNGPGEVRVSTKSPATTAATRVERSGTDWASSTMLGKASDSPAAGGSRTPSMMWATPFDALLSAPTTVLKSLPSGLTNTPLPFLYTFTFLPSTVFTLWKNFKSVDNTSDPKTW